MTLPPIGIDFETRSRLDLQEVGSSRYAKDPSTEIICLAWRDDVNEGRGLWRPGIRPPLNLALKDRRFVAHNAGFDRRIWEHIFVPLTGFPCPPLERWECSAVRCSANGLPRDLDRASEAVGLGYAKDPEETKALKKMMKPDKSGNFPDAPELRKLVESRCLTDVDYMIAILERTAPLSDAEREWWLFDQRCNDLGIPVDLRSAKRIIANLGEMGKGGIYEHARRRLWEATDYQVASPTRLQEFKNWLKTQDCQMNSLAADQIKDELFHNTSMSDLARNALELKSALGGASVKKYPALVARAEPDPLEAGYGWLRDAYVCHGAHPGRDTSKGFQTQNMKRQTASPEQLAMLLDATNDSAIDTMLMLDEEPLKIAGECVRLMVKALPGHKLFVGDFSKIQLVGLFWLAGEEGGLEKIRNGIDLYCDLASVVFRETVTKADAEKRQIGKHGVLGSGFGCGADRFEEMCWEVGGLRIGSSIAKRCIDAYREMYKAVPRYWYALEGAIRKAIVNQCGIELGKLRIASDGKKLVIKLPSGRKMRYQSPRVDSDGRIRYMGIRPVSNTWGWIDSWGGKFTENVVMGIETDLLRLAALRLTRKGYPIIMRSHDELVAHVLEGTGELAEFTRIMELKDDVRWWAGLPITVEAKEMVRYSK